MTCNNHFKTLSWRYLACILTALWACISCSNEQRDKKPVLIWERELPDPGTTQSGPSLDSRGEVLCITGKGELKPGRPNVIVNVFLFRAENGELINKIEQGLDLVRPANIPDYPIPAAYIIMPGCSMHATSNLRGPGSVLSVTGYIRLKARTYDISSGKLLGEFEVAPTPGPLTGIVQPKRRWFRPLAFLHASSERAYCFACANYSLEQGNRERLDVDLVTLTPEDTKNPAKTLLSFYAERERDSTVDFISILRDWEDKWLIWLHEYGGKCYVTAYDPELREFITLAEGARENFSDLRKLDSDASIYDRRTGQVFELDRKDFRKGGVVLGTWRLGAGQKKVLWRDPKGCLFRLFSHPHRRYLATALGVGEPPYKTHEIVILHADTLRELCRWTEKGEFLGMCFCRHTDRLFLAFLEKGDWRLVLKCYKIPFSE